MSEPKRLLDEQPSELLQELLGSARAQCAPEHVRDATIALVATSSAATSVLSGGVQGSASAGALTSGAPAAGIATATSGAGVAGALLAKVGLGAVVAGAGIWAGLTLSPAVQSSAVQSSVDAVDGAELDESLATSSAAQSAHAGLQLESQPGMEVVAWPLVESSSAAPSSGTSTDTGSTGIGSAGVGSTDTEAAVEPSGQAAARARGRASAARPRHVGLSAELEFIRRARQHLRARQYQAVEMLAVQHSERFAGGQFRGEMQQLRIAARRLLSSQADKPEPKHD